MSQKKFSGELVQVETTGTKFVVQGLFIQQFKKMHSTQQKTFSRVNRELSRIRGKFSDFIYLLFL